MGSFRLDIKNNLIIEVSFRFVLISLPLLSSSVVDAGALYVGAPLMKDKVLL
jgi:hypothetical protein